MNDHIYFHKNYVHLFPQKLQDAIKFLPKHLEFNIIKYNSKDDTVSFIFSPDFDEVYHPTIVQSAKMDLNNNGKPLKIYRYKSNLKIYHHRWLFVQDDYKGFDVKKDKKWSALWSKVPRLNHLKYGTLHNWNTITLPRILAYYNANSIEEVVENTHKVSY